MFVYDVLCFYHQTVKDMHRLDIHYMYCHGSSTEKKKLPGSRCVSHRCPKLASSTPRRRCRAPRAMLSSLTQGLNVTHPSWMSEHWQKKLY
jgi:hypothetical protein